MKTWSDLYLAHRTIRAIDRRWIQAIRNRLEVLKWVLSQIVPTPQFEPAPWAELQSAIKKAFP